MSMSPRALVVAVLLSLAAALDLWVAFGSGNALLWVAQGVLWGCAIVAWRRALWVADKSR